MIFSINRFVSPVVFNAFWPIQFENLVKEGGMKIVSDPDDDVFIDENKSLLK